MPEKSVLVQVLCWKHFSNHPLTPPTNPEKTYHKKHALYRSSYRFLKYRFLSHTPGNVQKPVLQKPVLSRPPPPPRKTCYFPPIPPQNLCFKNPVLSRPPGKKENVLSQPPQEIFQKPALSRPPPPPPANLSKTCTKKICTKKSVLSLESTDFRCTGSSRRRGGENI